MAIDSAIKRCNVIQVGLPFVTTLPIPDGSITSQDFAHLGHSYSLVGDNPIPPDDIITEYRITISYNMSTGMSNSMISRIQ